jgi:hypothetical protein
MTDPKINFIVCAPPFNENSGGTIFLHELANSLNRRGENAKLWPMTPIRKPGLRRKFERALRGNPYRTSPDLNTPVATRADVTDATVAVYPEVQLGNPVQARHVARWLLYTPGKRNPYQFGDDEMYFRVDEFADMPELTGGAPDLFMWKVNRTYRNENRPDRSGTCFIVRKWGDGPRPPLPENAIQLDGMSHEEINEVFNRCETFYSYDDATMYSQYAAICGCLSVVLPSGEGSRDQMLANHMLGRYGIAYGLEEEKIAHAIATRDKVLDLLLEREREGERTVDRFIELTKATVRARSANG